MALNKAKRVKVYGFLVCDIEHERFMRWGVYYVHITKVYAGIGTSLDEYVEYIVVSYLDQVIDQVVNIDRGKPGKSVLFRHNRAYLVLKYMADDIFIVRIILRNVI